MPGRAWILLSLIAGLLAANPPPPSPANGPIEFRDLRQEPPPKPKAPDIKPLIAKMREYCERTNYDMALETAHQVTQVIEECNFDDLADMVLNLALIWAVAGQSIPDVGAEQADFYALAARVSSELRLPRHEFASLALLYARTPTADLGRRLMEALAASKQGSIRIGTGNNVNLIEKYVADFTQKFPDDIVGRIFQARLLVAGRQFAEAISRLNALKAVAEKPGGPVTALPEISLWKARAELNNGDFEPALETARKGSEAAEARQRNLGANPTLVPAADLLREWQYLGRMSSELAQVSHDALEARTLGIYLSFKAPEFLPLGIYHLMSEKHGPLPPFLELHVINGEAKEKTLVFSSEVLDVTYESIDQFVLPAHSASGKGLSYNTRVFQTPPVRSDFKPDSIVESVERPIRIRVTQKGAPSDRVLLTRTIPVSLWPRTRFLKSLTTISGDALLCSNTFTSWVTPRGRWVQEAIRGAKKYLPKGLEFYGLGAAGVRTPEQVKALYDYLKIDKKVSYVGTAIGLEKGCFYQEVRLPSEILATSNALCVEGTVAFATLIEAIGLEPVVILLPGHAIVGWFDDKGPCKYKGRGVYILETTVIFTKEFADALTIGEKTWKEKGFPDKIDKVQFDVLEVRLLRERGFLPQPFSESEK